MLSSDPAVEEAEQRRQRGAPDLRSASLTAAPTTVELGGGLPATTWAFGAAVPGPEIRVRRGQRLRVQVENRLPTGTSLHWHGLAIRNDMDGVAGLTQSALPPGISQRYEFIVPDAGTYWYHPHVGVQLDRGLYGPLIIDDPDERTAYDEEWILVLDDWIDGVGPTPTTPDAQLDKLRAEGMGSMSMGDTASPTPSAPLGSDTGDVTYPYYLINGRVQSDPVSLSVRSGMRVRLRIINAGGDTAFRVGIPATPITITHTDGLPINPVPVDSVILGMGERIDAIVTVPQESCWVVALPEGKQGMARALLAVEPRRRAADLNATAINALRVSAPFDTAYATAQSEISLPTRRADVSHNLTLSGPGAGYEWTINGVAYNPRRGLPVSEGQRVRLTFDNQSGMFHPMHLHGHSFQVIHLDGTPGPRKDTVLVPPRARVTVEFDADNPGQWLSHCHNVYHGEAGMMTVISYVK